MSGISIIGRGKKHFSIAFIQSMKKTSEKVYKLQFIQKFSL